MTSLFCPLLFPDYTNSKLKSIILLKSYLRHSLIQAYPLKFNIYYSYYFILGRTNTLRNLFKPRQLPSATSKQCFEQSAAIFLVCFLIFIEYKNYKKRYKEKTLQPLYFSLIEVFLISFFYFWAINSTIISIYMTRVNKNPARQKNLMNLG